VSRVTIAERKALINLILDTAKVAKVYVKETLREKSYEQLLKIYNSLKVFISGLVEKVKTMVGSDHCFAAYQQLSDDLEEADDVVILPGGLLLVRKNIPSVVETPTNVVVTVEGENKNLKKRLLVAKRKVKNKFFKKEKKDELSGGVVATPGDSVESFGKHKLSAADKKLMDMRSDRPICEYIAPREFSMDGKQAIPEYMKQFLTDGTRYDTHCGLIVSNDVESLTEFKVYSP